MDYEKKYKQLHTLISDLYPFMSEYCKEKVEGFFPELKKSEDEKIRKALIDFFYRGAENGEQTNGVCDKDILAWLEKQGEKPQRMISAEEKEVLYNKPAWSEEDEEIKERLIRLCTQYMIPDGVAITCESWLKSLKPQNRWKPSEEQMLALKDAECIVGSLTIIGEQLKSLYQDLKKL